MPARHERADIVELIEEPGIPPKTALSIIENMTDKAAPVRHEIIKLSKSDDRAKRDLGMTKAEDFRRCDASLSCRPSSELNVSEGYVT